MEIKIKLLVLFLSILLTGLTAGLCFIWSNTITSGIGRLDDLGFLQSFQAMNRTILNGSFFTVFLALYSYCCSMPFYIEMQIRFCSNRL